MSIRGRKDGDLPGGIAVLLALALMDGPELELLLPNSGKGSPPTLFPPPAAAAANPLLLLLLLSLLLLLLLNVALAAAAAAGGGVGRI